MARHSVIAGGTAGQPSLGVVIVGAGFIADHHGAALRTSDRAHLAGIVDVDAGRAATAGRTAGGVPWTTDLAEALARPDVDAAIVCTPNVTHEAIALQVAAAGKHLLVEKPLSVDVPSARRVIHAFEQAGTTVMAAHTHRFYDYARAVADAIGGGAVGTPVFARLALLGGWIWPDWRAWVVDPGVSGGHALHNGVHLLDLVTWWIGAEPVSVYARGRKQTAAELGIHDYLEMTIDYDNGASAVCEMSRGHRPASLDRRDVLVVGTDGILQLPTDGWGSTVVTESGTALLHPQASDGFAVQLGAWLDAIDGGADAAMTPADALRAVALGVAAERSIERGEPVSVAEVLGGVPA
ncbi:Gfo/Idh/MocA family protein [Jiangella asiatica]|uniref:Gfo/Idh/MocA family oxidoreductase n=1 Tax=Jiangella asiatica TaxID=2530372 RepID=A0A4R5CHH2_9ACTN|nr:Gfo/Idh/MocA family oxidoreductase [Jiangella asiatica]TDD96774.1 Gfo/Idh/MocA family oxidoreductase [Jiangella asiatica]